MMLFLAICFFFKFEKFPPAKKRNAHFWKLNYFSEVISETLDKVSVSTTFAQSRQVLFLTPFKLLGLEESWS
jgi:hypothetical protein